MGSRAAARHNALGLRSLRAPPPAPHLPPALGSRPGALPPRLPFDRAPAPSPVRRSAPPRASSAPSPPASPAAPSPPSRRRHPRAPLCPLCTSRPTRPPCSPAIPFPCGSLLAALTSPSSLPLSSSPCPYFPPTFLQLFLPLFSSLCWPPPCRFLSLPWTRCFSPATPEHTACRPLPSNDLKRHPPTSDLVLSLVQVDVDQCRVFYPETNPIRVGLRGGI